MTVLRIEVKVSRDLEPKLNTSEALDQVRTRFFKLCEYSDLLGLLLATPFRSGLHVNRLVQTLEPWHFDAVSSAYNFAIITDSKIIPAHSSAHLAHGAAEPQAVCKQPV